MSWRYSIRHVDAGRRMQQRIKKTGKTLKGHWLWTKEEDALVRSLYPDYKALRKKLRRRTFGAIKARACSLGITKKRKRWTGLDIARLRKIFPEGSRKEILESFPGTHWKQVYARALYAGFRRKRQRFKKTGHPELDMIRAYAFSLNLSMADLDKMARTGVYFQKAGWHVRGVPSEKAMRKAVRALGGKNMPCFPGWSEEQRKAA